MRIIDVHLHMDMEDKKDKLGIFRDVDVDYTKDKLLADMKAADVEHAIFNTVDSIGDGIECSVYATPIRMKEALEHIKDTPNLHLMPGINPNQIPKNALKLMEDALKKGLIKGFKILPGYTHFYPQDKVYHKFYNLAIKYDVPVMFHTGDLNDGEGLALAKYCHPMHLDEVAVNFRKLKIVMAHLGNPWIRDAAIVLNKNPNVYADLSGFFVEDVPKRCKFTESDIQFALEYVNEPEKFLYGTDWPLVKMADYAAFMKRVIPSWMHKKIFYDNAKSLFKL
ncbi:MAG: amidohydrolase family protein [Nanoarchaeota archaeon]|nr:amidohydrolase family protein [Nanoarchaeota archaeon]